MIDPILHRSHPAKRSGWKSPSFFPTFEPMQTQNPRLSCVIFDVDGTLTRTNSLIFATFNHLTERHLGRTFRPEEIIALFGPPEEGALAKVFGSENIDRLMEELLQYYAANHAAMASLHGGMEPLLRFLKERGIRLAVFTGKGRHTTRITLETLGIASYFDLVVSGNDVRNHKPHPEGILKILEHFGVEPGAALMVGDSLSDIRAARGAGVRIAAVLWDAYDRAGVMAAKPDSLFERVDEMHAWLREVVN
jgi:HAD superfamily hydrolase (TIGR01509 family)